MRSRQVRRRLSLALLSLLFVALAIASGRPAADQDQASSAGLFSAWRSPADVTASWSPPALVVIHEPHGSAWSLPSVTGASTCERSTGAELGGRLGTDRLPSLNDGGHRCFRERAPPDCEL